MVGKAKDITMSTRVVITGIGPVTSVGTGKKQFFHNLIKPVWIARKIPTQYNRFYHFHSQYYVPLPKISGADYGIPAKYERIMQPEDTMAVAAAKLALEDAGYILHKNNTVFTTEPILDCGAIIGTGLGGLENAFHSYLAHVVNDKSIRSTLQSKPGHFQRLIIPMVMPNSVTAWISQFFGLTGDCHTLNASCASGTMAIGEAYRKIKFGPERIILTGGVECLQDDCGSIMRGFDMLGVLTKSSSGMPLPFSHDRSGFLFAEGGACMFVLEEYEHARERGVPMYAEIVDYHANSNAYNIVKMEPSGNRIRALLKAIKKDYIIDYINAHGTGTEENDDIEANAIQEVFGNRDQQPLISSTKGIMGHTLGASGACEAGFTALAIKGSYLHGNPTPHPLKHINLLNHSISHPINYAISCSFGFGGHNAALLFQRVEPHG